MNKAVCLRLTCLNPARQPFSSWLLDTNLSTPSLVYLPAPPVPARSLSVGARLHVVPWVWCLSQGLALMLFGA